MQRLIKDEARHSKDVWVEGPNIFNPGWYRRPTPVCLERHLGAANRGLTSAADAPKN